MNKARYFLYRHIHRMLKYAVFRTHHLLLGLVWHSFFPIVLILLSHAYMHTGINKKAAKTTTQKLKRKKAPIWRMLLVIFFVWTSYINYNQYCLKPHIFSSIQLCAQDMSWWDGSEEFTFILTSSIKIECMMVRWIFIFFFSVQFALPFGLFAVCAYGFIRSLNSLAYAVV